MGGGSVIGFTARNIECKLVEMGLEGMYMDPDTGIRPRVRVSERHRSTEKAEMQAPQLGVHLAQPYQGMGGFALTEDQKEILYDQVERREVPDDEGYPMEGVGQDEDDVQIKEEAQQDMGVLRQVPAGLQNGHISHFQVGPGGGGDI